MIEADVLDHLDRTTVLYIYVGVEGLGQERTVGYNPFVVDCYSFAANVDDSGETSVTWASPAVQWVAIKPCLRLLLQVAWILFRTRSVGTVALHARGVPIQRATRSMHHLSLDDVVQLRVPIRIWKLGTDEGAQLVRVNLVAGHMRMWTCGKLLFGHSVVYISHLTK